MKNKPSQVRHPLSSSQFAKCIANIHKLSSTKQTFLPAKILCSPLANEIFLPQLHKPAPQIIYDEKLAIQLLLPLCIKNAI